MKPCVKNKQAITLLAVNALGAEAADKLRQHLGTCPGCHRYWEEISKTCQEHLTAAEALPASPASPAFHQRLVQRINQSDAQPGSFSVGELLRSWLATRQVALATAASALVLLRSSSDQPHWAGTWRVGMLSRLNTLVTATCTTCTTSAASAFSS